ncbi:DEAD/DEAH box helicase [Desulfurococcaceae archaeon MEX13E-LK6-19]|nr:DEAD/DEAH box helicase [Desulfurococcaceae archaeon MEX13E-LK6-19]
MKVDRLVDYGFPVDVVEILRKRGINEFNPVQEKAIEAGLFSGKNILVSSPTASGKTLIAELALVKAFLEGKMGVYLTPLKALASEKYEEFKVWESIGAKIGISTGDYESPGEYLGRYNIVVATYERFDSLLRLKPWWLRRVGVVVIDELHMVSDGERGPVLEMIIARIKMMDNVQLIGLSATIGNSLELSRWLGAELVNIDWRPVKLVEGVYDRKAKAIFFSDGRVEKIVHRLSNNILSVVLQSITNGYQVLVFIHNRKRTENYAAELVNHMNLLEHTLDKKRLGEYVEKLKQESPSRMEAEKLGNLIMHGVAYHHAGLSMAARRIVEEAFRERLIKAVFATPTLAAGVNLPARRVIVSIKRYDPSSRRNRDIPVFEYKQMAGRAGRPKYDPYGEAIIIDAGKREEGFKKYVYGRLEPVESKLASERALRIHVLALIAGGEAPSLDALLRVMENTLFYHQFRSKRYLEAKIERIVEDLWEWGMIERRSNMLLPTEIGRIITHTYLDPLTGYEFLEKMKGQDKPGVLRLLHIIASTPDYLRSRPYITASVMDKFEEEAWEQASRELIPVPPDDEADYVYWLQAYVHARMLYDWINEASEDTISQRYGVGPGDIYSARDTAAWIASGLSRIARVAGLGEASMALEKLSIRLEYGVREDALELIKLEGIGRVRARTLIRAGINSLEKLAKTPSRVLVRLPGFGPKIVESIKKQLADMGYSVVD